MSKVFFLVSVSLDGYVAPPGMDMEHASEPTYEDWAAQWGKRMFKLGEAMWPEEAPFHTPVLVLTSQVREPWVRPGGTSFHFVNDGIESALRQARAVAGDRDIRIAGGANAIQQYLRAGLVDELTLAISPVIFGGGPRLFAGIGRDVGVELVETIASPRATHVRYAVHKP
jgi:dihydrofolate reductase